MKTVVVHEALTEFDALSIRDMLVQEGIPALIRPVQVAGLNLDMGMGRGLIWGLVEVEEPAEEKARELIGGFLGSLGMLEEAGPNSVLDEPEPDSITGEL